MYYKLENTIPVPCSLEEWATKRRGLADDFRVKLTDIDGWTVSTVFLGLDHRFTFNNESLPILFETMIFSPSHGDQFQYRYSTWEEASAGHDLAASLLKDWLDKAPKDRHLISAFEALLTHTHT